MEFQSQFSKTGGGERKEIFQNEEQGELNDIEVTKKDIELQVQMAYLQNCLRK